MSNFTFFKPTPKRVSVPAPAAPERREQAVVLPSPPAPSFTVQGEKPAVPPEDAGVLGPKEQTVLVRRLPAPPFTVSGRKEKTELTSPVGIEAREFVVAPRKVATARR